VRGTSYKKSGKLDRKKEKIMADKKVLRLTETVAGSG